MKTLRFAAIASLALGGLWGCSWFGGNDSRDDRSRDDGYRDDRHSRSNEDLTIRRGGPREDWNHSHNDPVCSKFVSAKDAHTVAYQGRNYYFHTKDCAKKFRDNPDSYLMSDYDRRAPNDRPVMP